jgi:hypothetical protein
VLPATALDQEWTTMAIAGAAGCTAKQIQSVGGWKSLADVQTSTLRSNNRRWPRTPWTTFNWPKPEQKLSNLKSQVDNSADFPSKSNTQK